MKLIIAILIAAWFAAVLILGAAGSFNRAPGSPPIPILIGALAPLAAFIAAYFGSGAFRRLVLNADLRLLTAIQAWRAGGLAFLALYAYGLLPGTFAQPAAWGDMAIGFTAPWIVLALIRRSEFAGSRVFIAWNIFGILDLVVAVTMGALSSGLFPALSGPVTTAPMSQLPLVIIPAFGVPLFVMLHLAALLQARHALLGRESTGHVWGESPTGSTRHVANA